MGNKKLLLLMFLLACTLRLYGQTALKGIVRDSASMEPIAGATLIVKETMTGEATDSDGNFVLTQLPTGNFTLLVEYLTSAPKEIPLNGSSLPDHLEILLQEEDLQMDNVIVVGRRRLNTESSMIATQRNALQVTSGLSAAQISRSADRDASEVVKRIPGITILNDRFIIVRGLSQRYNNTWINGLAVPSTETDSRAFSFDLIPSSQIENIVVYKSPSPEIPADFSGGFVKITTRAIPDENAMNIGYTTGFNVRTQFRDFYRNPGSSTDFLGFDISKRPLANHFPSDLRLVKDADRLTDLTLSGFNNDWSIKKSTPLPDQRVTFSIARRLKTRQGKEIGHITAVNYSNTSKTATNIKNARYGIYSSATDRPVLLDDYNDRQYTNDVRVGLMHNWSYQAGTDSRYEFKNLMNLLGRNRLTERTGVKYQSGTYYREQTEMMYNSRFTYSGQFAGTHDLHQSGKLDWHAGYSYASRNEPDRRIVKYEDGIGDVSDITTLTPTIDNIHRYFSNLYDHNFSGTVDYSLPLTQKENAPVLKTGIYAEYQKRDYRQREFIYNFDQVPYNDRSTYFKLPFAEMLSSQYLGADKVFIEEDTKKRYNYDANVHLDAVYAAIQWPLGRWSIYAGARAEYYHMKLGRDNSISYETVLKTSNKHSSLDVLPSVNLTYKFNDRHQLRAAYGRSLNRPELREVSPAVYYDFDLFNEIGGNENLKTAYIHNTDLRYEFYPSRGEIISIGVFYKNFKNPIEWSYIDMGGTLRYNYENARSADNYGVEIDIRKSFDFLGLPDLSLVMNASVIESNIKFYEKEMGRTMDRSMQGQSPYVINTGLYYHNPTLGLSASALYNRIGKRIIGIGRSSSANTDLGSMIPDSYEMPRNQVDLTVSKTIGKRIELKAAVKDLLSEKIIYKQFPKFEKEGNVHKRNQITRSLNPGQSVQIGLSVKL